MNDFDKLMEDYGLIWAGSIDGTESNSMEKAVKNIENWSVDQARHFKKDDFLTSLLRYSGKMRIVNPDKFLVKMGLESTKKENHNYLMKTMSIKRKAAVGGKDGFSISFPYTGSIKQTEMEKIMKTEDFFFLVQKYNLTKLFDGKKAMKEFEKALKEIMMQIKKDVENQKEFKELEEKIRIVTSEIYKEYKDKTSKE